MVAKVYGETIEKEMKPPGLNGTHLLKYKKYIQHAEHVLVYNLRMHFVFC